MSLITVNEAGSVIIRLGLTGCSVRKLRGGSRPSATGKIILLRTVFCILIQSTWRLALLRSAPPYLANFRTHKRKRLSSVCSTSAAEPDLSYYDKLVRLNTRAFVCCRNVVFIIGYSESPVFTVFHQTPSHSTMCDG